MKIKVRKQESIVCCQMSNVKCRLVVNCQSSIVNCRAPRAGFSLIEILLGVGILSLIITVIAGALSFVQQSLFLIGERSRAIDIAEEGLEASRNIRDEAFASLLVGTNGVSTTSSRYGFSGAFDVIDGIFTRTVNVAQPDNVRRKLTSTVTWTLRDSQTASVQLMTELADWTRKSAGGAPSLCASYDLTTVNSGSNTADGISVAFNSPYLYLGRQNNPGANFFIFDVSTFGSPVLKGSLALNGDPNSMVVSGNYVYIASTANAQELQVVDVSNAAAPALAASFDLTAANSGSANADALSITMTGAKVYLGRTNAGKEFYVFNVSVPTAPALFGTLDLNGSPNDMIVSGSYVYIASDDNVSELQIVDISNSLLPTLAGTLDLDSGDPQADGKSIAVNGAEAYLGRKGSPGAPEFYVINVTTPAAPVLDGTLDLGSLTVNSIDVSTTASLAFIVNTAPSTNDYKAIDVSAPTTPNQISNIDLPGVPYDVTFGSALSTCNVFIASGADSAELEIISP